MKDVHILSSEWKVMEVLWDDAPKTLMELVRVLAERVGWKKSTVTTMLSRMEKKRLIRYETDGRTKHFFPAMTRQEAMSSEADALVEKAFRGSAGLLVSCFLERDKLSPQEIGELYDFLRRSEEEAT